MCQTRKVQVDNAIVQVADELHSITRDKKNQEKSRSSKTKRAATGDPVTGGANVSAKANLSDAPGSTSKESDLSMLSSGNAKFAYMKELLPVNVNEIKNSAQDSFAILHSDSTLRHIGPVYLVHLNDDCSTLIVSGTLNVYAWDMSSKAVKNVYRSQGIFEDHIFEDFDSLLDQTKVKSGLAVLHHTDKAVKFMLKGRIISCDAKSDGTFVRETNRPSGTFWGQSPNGKFVLTSRGMWSTQTRQYVGPAIRHESGIMHVAISLNGRRVAIGTEAKSIVVWEYNVVDNQWINKITIKTRCGIICMSPDGTLLASGSSDLKIWKLHRNPADCSLHACELGPTHTPMMLNGVSILRFSPDGKRLVCGGKSGDIQVWNSSDVSLEYKLAGHTASILSLAFSKTGELLVSGSSDWTARTWRLPALPKDPEHAPEFLRCNCFLMYSGMNIRTGPSTSDKIKGTLCQDEVIRVLEKKGNWVRHARGWSAWKCGKTNKVQLVRVRSRSAHWVPHFFRFDYFEDRKDTEGVYVQSDKTWDDNKLVVYAGPHCCLFNKIGTLNQQSTNLVLEILKSKRPVDCSDYADTYHIANDRRGIWIRVSDGWIYRKDEKFKLSFKVNPGYGLPDMLHHTNFRWDPIQSNDVSAAVSEIDRQYYSK